MRWGPALATAVLLAGSGCSHSADGSDAAGFDRTGVPVAARVATCNATDFAINGPKMMAETNAAGGHVSFTSIVMEDEPHVLSGAISGMVGLSLEDVDYGPYTPILRFLPQRNTAWTPEFSGEVKAPKRTAKVIASAKALDAALADGMCKPETS